ncbi:twin-arginine translocation signal domain-containing protein, partial [Cronobacter sakazakii]
MQEHDIHGVPQPARRRLLKGLGALTGALAVTGGCP